MLKREDFIGTIMGDYLITGVAGEGAEGVVFIVAHMSDLSKSDKVIKMLKPLTFLEMDVLHHSFKIHKELYPDHHLIMSDEERLKKLQDEMLKKAKKPGIIYRLHDISNLYNQTLEVLARQYFEGYKSNNLANDFLTSNPAISIFVDAILQHKVSDFLDEGLVVDQYNEFFEFLSEKIEEKIISEKENSPIATVSQSVLSNLFGLFLEGFISQEELRKICRSSDFRSCITNSDLEIFFQLLTIFYYLTSSELENFEKQTSNIDKKDSDEFDMDNYKYNVRKNGIERKILSIILGFELLTELSLSDSFYNKEIAGLGYLWSSYALQIKNKNAELKTCKDYLNKSIELFTEIGSLGNLHDAYLSIAQILKNEDKSTSKKYIEMAIQIKKDIENESKNTAANT